MSTQHDNDDSKPSREELAARIDELEAKIDSGDTADAEQQASNDGVEPWGTTTRRGALAAVAAGLGVTSLVGTAAGQTSEQRDACTWIGNQNAAGYNLRNLGNLTFENDSTITTTSSGLELDSLTLESLTTDEAVVKGNPVYNIRAYGAVGDGSTDDTQAIADAIADAKQDNGVVYVPKGDYLTDQHTLDASHNGITIAGEGYGSHLKANDAGGSNHSIFRLDDGTNAITDISIKNLRIDGNKSGQSGTPNGWGLIFVDNSNADEGVEVRNVWAHDWLTTGVSITMQAVTVSGLRSWSNDTHGLKLSSTNNKAAHGYDIQAWDNGSYGIDCSSGRVVLSGFACHENADGLKTSSNADQMVISDGVLYNNTGVGFQMTGSAKVLMFHNVVAVDNGEHGFRFANSGSVRGDIIAYGNDTANTAGMQVYIKDSIRFRGSIIANNSANGDGVQVDGGRVEAHIEAVSNAGRGVDTTSSTVIIDGGYIADNGNTYGAFSNAGHMELHNVEFEDTGGGTQTYGFGYTGGSGYVKNVENNGLSYRIDDLSVRVVDCDFVTSDDATANVWVNDFAKAALGGSAPDATNYEVGMTVEDTDNSGTLYYVYDDTATSGATAI